MGRAGHEQARLGYFSLSGVNAVPLGKSRRSTRRTQAGVNERRRANHGKSLIVVRRYAAHVRLRYTVYHWARVATQRDPKCRARYTALRKRGHSHGRALRGVADRLLALACVLLQRQTLFDLSFWPIYRITGPSFKARQNLVWPGEVSSFGLSARFSVSNRGSCGKFFRQPFVRAARGVVDTVGTPFIPTREGSPSRPGELHPEPS